MANDAAKVSDALRRRGGASARGASGRKEHDEGLLAADVAAVQSIRSLGETLVSVTIEWSVPAQHRIAFQLPATRAEELIRAAVAEKEATRVSGSLKPNATLVEALVEGRQMGGRFASAAELFDALENEKQD